MQRKVPATYSLFLVIAMAILFLSNNSNPPNGYTGAPPNGQTCASCHGGGSPSGNVAITGLPATIIPDQIYPITVTVTRTTGTPQKAGFQMTALNGSNNFTGAFTSPSAGTTIQSTGGIFYFEHNPGQSFGAGNTLNFTVNWRAPATGSGPITFYAAANLVNNNNSTTGDFVTTTVASGTLDGSGGAIIPNVSSTPVTCFGGSNGTATANPTGGGGGPYSYMWSTGSMQQSINNLSAGTYFVTVMNGLGDMGVGMTTVGSPPQLFVNITASGNISCANPNGFATAQASGGVPGYTYAWSTGATGASATFSTPGTYFVTATDASQCPVVTSVTITANTTPPTAFAGPDRTISCSAPTTMLNGVGSSTGAGISYLWTGPGIVSGGTTLTPVVNMTGTYTLTVTNQTNGCTATDQVVVGSNTTPPTANAGPEQTLTCAITSVTLNGTGSSSGANIVYAWAGPGIVSGGATASPVVNVAGTYTLTVTNESNGCAAMDQTNVVVNTALGLEVQTTPVNCFGNNSGTATATASGGSGNYTYAWSTGATTAQITGLAAGTYNVTATNGNCTATGSATVSQPPVLIVNALTTAETAPGASDGSATAMAMGGTPDYTFVWSTGATTAAITGLAPGTYSVTASDSQGCTASTTAEVNNSICSGFAIALTPTDMVCQDDMSGSVAAVLTGGTEPFTFGWSNGGTESGISGLAAGVYSVSVTDANNCSLTASAAVALLPDLTPPVVVAQALTVYLSAAGEVEITPEMADNGSSDNCGIVEWQLSKSQFFCDETGVQIITLTAVDAAGNEAMAELPVTVVDTIAPFILCPASVEVTGCSLVYNYGPPAPILEFCGGELFFIPVELISGLPSGSVFPIGESIVTLGATDPSGNSTACSFSVNISTPPPTVVELVAPLCNGSADGSIRVTPFGDFIGYTYQWDDPLAQTDAIAVGLSAGTYSVIVSGNSNGCVDTFTYMLEAPTSVEITLDELVAELSVEMNGAISVTASGGQGAPYTYIWRFNGQVVSMEEDLTGLSMGEYILTVVDFNGCVAVDTFVVDRLTNSLEPETDYALLVYPNPAEDELNLQITGEKSANLEVALMDLDGRLLHQPVQAFSARHTFSVNVADYVPGVYLARIIIGEKVLWRKVVVE